MEKKKTNKEYLQELQVIADKHSETKDAIEYLLKEGDGIKDKLKESERVFGITESINKMMLDLDLLEEEYALKKDYSTLKMLLEEQLKTKQYLEMLKQSDDGLSLFPAQPFLYLMNGRALNSLRKHKEALSILEEGLDYIIEDDQIKAAFYEELSLGHKALGNNKIATEYHKQATELKAK